MAHKDNIVDEAENGRNEHRPADEIHNGAGIKENKETDKHHKSGRKEDVAPGGNAGGTKLQGGANADERGVDNPDGENNTEEVGELGAHSEGDDTEKQGDSTSE